MILNALRLISIGGISSIWLRIVLFTPDGADQRAVLLWHGCCLFFFLLGIPVVIITRPRLIINPSRLILVMCFWLFLYTAAWLWLVQGSLRKVDSLTLSNSFVLAFPVLSALCSENDKEDWYLLLSSMLLQISTFLISGLAVSTLLYFLLGTGQDELALVVAIPIVSIVALVMSLTGILLRRTRARNVEIQRSTSSPK